MVEFNFWQWQLRGIVVLTLAYPLLALGCRGWRIESSRLRWLVVLAVLCAAISPWGIPVELAWFPTPASKAEVSERFVKNEPRLEITPQRDTETAPSFLLEPRASLAESPILSPPAATWHFPSFRSGLHFSWLIFIGCLLTFSCYRYLQVAFAAAARIPLESVWQSEWQQLLREQRLHREIPMIATLRVGPMLGLLPHGFALLIPAEFWRSLETNQRRAILKHELAHYRRGDVWASALLRILALPFAYHPFCWKLLALFEEAAEWECDQAACSRHERVTYAQALERLVASEYPEISLALGRCAQSHPLVNRVRRILNPTPGKDSLMKTMFFALLVATLATASMLQVRLVAQERPDAAIETVKTQMEGMETKLRDLKSAADDAKSSHQQLEERVNNNLQRLKDLAADPSKFSAEMQRRVDLLKSGEEAKQLQALEGADKLGDEGLILCGFAAKEIDRDAVRERALAIAVAKGEEGLPVIAFAVNSLSAANRSFLLKEFVKHKEKVPELVFAKFAKDSVAENRDLALSTGLSITKNPLLFLATAAEANEENIQTLFAAGSKLKGDDLQLFLYAMALKGTEEILPAVIRKSSELKEAGYPMIAAAYKRNVAAARGEIVKLYRNSKNPVEQFVVREALRDNDEALRAAAEKANTEP